jgi:hypothetical protein
MRALKADIPGVVRDDRPATVLFGDFSALSKGLTQVLYKYIRIRRVTPDQIFTVTVPNYIVPDTASEEARIRAYFCGLGYILKPVLLEQTATIGVPTNLIGNLESAREILRGYDLTSLRERLKNADAALLQALQARALSQAGTEITGEMFPLLQFDRTSIEQSTEQLESEVSAAEQELEPFAKACRTRLRSALSLVRSPQVGSKIGNVQAIQDEIADMLHVLGKLATAFPSLLQLRREFAMFQALVSCTNETAAGVLIDECSERMQSLLTAIEKTLGTASYPFADVTVHVLLAEYAKSKEFNLDPRMALLKDAQSHLEMLFSVYYRALARLVEVAEKVESCLEMSGVITPMRRQNLQSE